MKEDERAGIAIQQRRRFDKLFPALTSFTFIRVVRITERLGIELEELSEIILGEVSGRIFCFVHHTSGEILLLAPFAWSV